MFVTEVVLDSALFVIDEILELSVTEPVLETTEQEPSVTEEAEASLETKVVIDAFEETVVVLVAREHSIGEATADIDELDTEENIATLSEEETRLQFEAVGRSVAAELAKKEGPFEETEGSVGCLAMSPLDNFPSSPKLPPTEAVVVQTGLPKMLGALAEAVTPMFNPPPSVKLLPMVAVVVVMVGSGPTESKADEEVDRAREEICCFSSAETVKEKYSHKTL